MPRNFIRIDDGTGRLVPFSLATDDKGLPAYTSHLLEPVHISVYSQSEEARYANLLPGVGSVYAQDELSGGLGKKVEVHREDPQFNRYYYGEWFDASVRGQAQKGPAITTLTAPANSGPLSGYFELAGVPYLVLSRRIASWASDALTAVSDYGAGVAGADAAIFTKLAAATAVDSNSASSVTTALQSADARAAQGLRTNTTGASYLSYVTAKLWRIGLTTPNTPAVTPQGTAGATTYSYKVSALSSGGGETPVSAAGTTATGNATLSTTNYNVVSWARITGAIGYNVYRTAGGAQTGFVGLSTGQYFNDTGLPGDSSTPNATDTSAQIAGDVRLSIQSDLNGNPSGQIITSASILAMDVPLGTGTDMTFKFDDDASLLLSYNTPYWLVLDCAAATTSAYVSWFRTANSDQYARGLAKGSTDRGNTWSILDTSSDFVFGLWIKQPTTTAFIGTSTGGNLFKTTSDGSTFTADTYRYSRHFAVVGQRLIRSIQDGVAATSIGALEWTEDGTNWNSDPIVVGDPAVPITNLTRLGDALIVSKEDGVYAVDILATPIDVQPLYGSDRATTNGLGSTYWRGAVYVPFNGRLMGVVGDFTAGFTVHESVGIEALQEWDWPWGQGRHVACVGTRFHLYSLVSTSGGYRLLKSADPLRKKADGLPDPEWHGSLATIGDGTQSCTMMAHFDPGGSGSPQLFITTTSNNIARVQLPRSFNPASDTSYAYDTSTTADLYFPVANGNYPVHPKAWLMESLTFAKATPNDYAELLFDSLDGESWRRLPLGRLYDTGALPYPSVTSQLLARRLQLTNSLSTASPLLYAAAVSYAMRHIKGLAMREISFTVVAEDGQSSADIGEQLGIGAASQRALLAAAAGAGLGVRKLEDPYGHVYRRVLFLDATETLEQVGQTSGGRTLVQVSAVAIS